MDIPLIAGTLIAGLLVFSLLTERVPGQTNRRTLAQIAFSLFVGWLVTMLLFHYGVVDPSATGPFEDYGL
jgi:hypothetical protein